MKEVEIGGMKCRLLPAPEPESIKWEHLEYTAKQRCQRRWKIMLLTVIALIVGAAIITYAGALKVGTKYVSFCKDVMGPNILPNYGSVCPVPSTEAEVGGDQDASGLYHQMFVELRSNPSSSNRPYKPCTTCTPTVPDVDDKVCADALIGADEATGRSNCEAAGEPFQCQIHHFQP